MLGFQGARVVVLQVENLHRVPDNLSDKEACFVEPLAAANRILEQKVRGSSLCNLSLGRHVLFACSLHDSSISCLTAIDNEIGHVIGTMQRTVGQSPLWQDDNLSLCGINHIQITSEAVVTVSCRQSSVGRRLL